MRLYKSIYLLVFFLFFSCSFNAANHYVDKNANGNNNGTSWSNAWESFSDIEWNQIQPGDTLFISGGSDSTVYDERLTVGKGGTYANLITIRAGLDAEHSGRVIFDGGGTTGHGVYLKYKDYVRIEKLEFRNHSGVGSIHLYGRDTSPSNIVNVIYIDSCTFTEIGGHGAIVSNGQPGIGNYGSLDSIFIRYCYIRSGQGTTQVDGIHIQYSQNIFIEDNTILIDNNVSTSHSDCIQFNHVENAIVKNNYMYEASDSPDRPNNILMWEDLSGDFYVYNNVLYYPNAINYMNCFIDKDNNYPHTIYYYSNTTVGGPTRHLALISTPNMICKNNIFYNKSRPERSSIDFPSSITDWSQVDGNLYGNFNVGTIDGKTMMQINALGGERSGRSANRYLVNPKFVRVGPFGSEDLSVQSSSPCINTGVDLGTPYNVDINGVTRPAGQYTIGAYQYEP